MMDLNILMSSWCPPLPEDLLFTACHFPIYIMMADGIWKVISHPRPQTGLTQKSVPKHVVSYKRCMKPSRTRLWGWSNLLWEVFPRYSQICQRKANSAYFAWVFIISTHECAWQCLTVHVSACQYMTMHVSACQCMISKQWMCMPQKKRIINQ